MTMLRAIAVLALVLLSGTARAGDYPAPREADWIARDFKFHTGEVMPELKLHYLTIGDPAGLPVLVLHGNGGAAASMLTPAFAGERFGPSQALDASKYYIVIPDALGHGKSAKPSDGLKTKFPRYNYVAINRPVSELHHSRTGKVVVTNSALVFIPLMNSTRR